MLHSRQVYTASPLPACCNANDTLFLTPELTLTGVRKGSIILDPKIHILLAEGAPRRADKEYAYSGNGLAKVYTLGMFLGARSLAPGARLHITSRNRSGVFQIYIRGRELLLNIWLERAALWINRVRENLWFHLKTVFPIYLGRQNTARWILYRSHICSSIYSPREFNLCILESPFQ
jgi:hypothetical protein